MGLREASPKKAPRRKRRGKPLKSKGDGEDLATLSQRILEEAKKIARMEIQKTATQVLSDATIIARWERNPFYIV